MESEFSSAEGKVREGLGAGEEAKDAIARATDALSAAFQASRDQIGKFSGEVDRIFSGIDADAGASVVLIDQMIVDLGDLVSKHEALRERLINDVEPKLPEAEKEAFAALIASLDAAIEQEKGLESRLQETADGITTGNSDVQQFRASINARITAAQTALDNADSIYANNLKPTLDELGTTLSAVGTSLAGVADQVSGVSGAAGGVVTVIENAASDNRALAEALGAAADEVDRVQQALSTAIDSGDFSQIGQIIGANPSVLATALAQPIGLERIPVYPVVSFGAGMAALYTVLSLWVGALLMSVTLRVAPPTTAFTGGPELKLHEQFLGRYMIFGLLGLAQSTLVFLGNILLVGLEPKHPLLFMLLGWVTSLVFTFIIYTLVVSFRDAGKALAVFLLVIQVAGAGGAYPLSLLPQWFQSVSPFLPGTHAMNAFRDALAGIYQGDYWVSLGLLVLFVVPMLVLGLAARKPMIGLNDKMEEMLQSTKLM